MRASSERFSARPHQLVAVLEARTAGWMGFPQQECLDYGVCMHIYTSTLACAFRMCRLKDTDISPSTTSRIFCVQVTGQQGRPCLVEDRANLTLPQAVAVTGLFYVLPPCSHGARLC